MSSVYQVLEKLNIQFKKHEHVAVFTNEESEKLGIGPAAQNTKNLFLADAKNERFYLLTIQHGKKADLKNFRKTAGERKLHFANEDWMKRLLNLAPGSVTPMGLLNDTDHKVKFYVDADLIKQEKIYVHPDVNTATLEITITDFKKFLEFTGHQCNETQV